MAVRSTFSGFSITQMAMSASQRALDVVGQNISNINTGGYTRQRLDLLSISPEGHSQWNMAGSVKVGQGVMMTGVSQIRDPYLDIQYRGQLTDVGTVDSKSTVLDKLADIFDETDRVAIRDALNNVVSQLQNMSQADKTGQDSADNLVRGAMESLLTLMHNNASRLDQTETELIDRLQGTETQKIQGYLESIKEYNEAIKTSQILGNPALELLDQRNAVIDELATYMPIEVTYGKEDVGGGFLVETLKISFKDEAGTKYTLVDDSEIGSVKIEADAGGRAPVEVLVTDTEGNKSDVTAVLDKGVLAGYTEMLNEKGSFADGQLETNGIPFYREYFDRFVDEFAMTLNKLNGVEYDDKGIVTANEDKVLFTTADGAAAGFTASNIRISDAWKSGSLRITTTTQGAPGADVSVDSANDNVLKMISALTNELHEIKNDDSVTIFKGTFFDIYDNLQNTNATDASSINRILKNRVSVLTQIADSKDSVSGVNLDEEVMDLMRYQQSYNAAARAMTIMDEVLDKLINSTGIAGR